MISNVLYTCIVATLNTNRPKITIYWSSNGFQKKDCLTKLLLAVTKQIVLKSGDIVFTKWHHVFAHETRRL